MDFARLALLFLVALQNVSSLHIVNKTKHRAGEGEYDLNLAVEINSDLEKLQKHVEQTANVESVEERKAEYERVLAEQLDKIDELTANNTALEEDIDGAQEECNTYRNQAKALVEKSEQIRASMIAAQANMVTAQDFAKNVLVGAHEDIHEANETEILRELSRQDNLYQRAHKRPVSPLAMIETVSKSTGDEQDMLAKLATSVTELQRQHEQDLATLEAQFAEKKAAGKKQLETLWSKNAELWEKKTTITELRDRLKLAYEAAQDNYDHLKMRSDALDKYIETLVKK